MTPMAFELQVSTPAPKFCSQEAYNLTDMVPFARSYFGGAAHDGLDDAEDRGNPGFIIVPVQLDDQVEVVEEHAYRHSMLELTNIILPRNSTCEGDVDGECNTAQPVTTPSTSLPSDDEIDDTLSELAPLGILFLGLFSFAFVCVWSLAALASAHVVARVHTSGYDHPYVRAVMRPRKRKNYGAVAGGAESGSNDVELVNWRVEDNSFAYLTECDVV